VNRSEEKKIKKMFNRQNYIVEAEQAWYYEKLTGRHVRDQNQ
jgi:hypothetical protein